MIEQQDEEREKRENVKVSEGEVPFCVVRGMVVAIAEVAHSLPQEVESGGNI